METIKFMEDTKHVNLEYDEDADTLYLSVGEPREAMGLDVGEGTVVRYDEKTREVVGLTLGGLRSRFVKELKQAG
ncbi:MAG: hypothetical protein A2268_03815 [Candidatus Raymondbacteria bacterium RifOxyA12_full_50_37]|uniref:DUF2283 domain-containing protein n=1 Tax=Candidatus Raymondbacteria bacterium RIFOXYD12_FULL_49_13 TaxID=1817890 RepID=A0A1F7FAX0_UNCRA|nr:MAG: hypothetical protein A2268_03815 [Candidatus Raymondbacteria bacterium RifOxyA12_full_50_37]OGJ92205.1 MAG: hypothetical protein A2350_14900 [Candidatus Raymondbacteria bacterium RifOxyB12_full_50_8]OGJ92657.1 MAG: hypothetical protein A2248_06135 [Candidatus Raymondbacteria bacterium RIFOXYA2_FULL_49_16]OGJ98011.1 MAG: hypothetical protein A2453_03160 [Candidatus Raymondbacteria bacterium RIFOXYC2_FULL_50_21]OGJ99868.1 MAG: hypothetical protein A2487_10960 [Candidatus Raymondbacteria b